MPGTEERPSRAPRVEYLRVDEAERQDGLSDSIDVIVAECERQVGSNPASASVSRLERGRGNVRKYRAEVIFPNGGARMRFVVRVHGGVDREIAAQKERTDASRLKIAAPAAFPTPWDGDQLPAHVTVYRYTDDDAGAEMEELDRLVRQLVTRPESLPTNDALCKIETFMEALARAYATVAGRTMTDAESVLRDAATILPPDLIIGPSALRIAVDHLPPASGIHVRAATSILVEAVESRVESGRRVEDLAAPD